MSSADVVLADLPVREELLDREELGLVCGGGLVWAGVKAVGKAILEGVAYDIAKAAYNKVCDRWDQYQEELAVEALTEAHHEFCAANFHKRG